jgi:Domain of unknown function (DUF1963)
LAHKYDIEFVEADAPITDPVTKFGGQPVWVEEPAWPLSRLTGTQMNCICRISVAPELFGGEHGRMAYVFMTGDGDPARASWWQRSRALFAGEGTWEPEGEENAVIVQPGAYEGRTSAIGKGPTLSDLDRGGPCEYAVGLELGEDPDFVGEYEQLFWDDETIDAYWVAVSGNKIGGTPGFIQSDEFPEGGPWRLLAQIYSAEVPFYVNFGDAGIGYAYISEDGRSGRFLWQCY